MLSMLIIIRSNIKQLGLYSISALSLAIFWKSSQVWLGPNFQPDLPELADASAAAVRSDASAAAVRSDASAAAVRSDASVAAVRSDASAAAVRSDN